ncbi:MAG: alkaline phosphatase D family protein [Planctomycetota bacterium]
MNVWFFTACCASLPAQSPQLGNGLRNSWATQESIVLWTRTTHRAEMVVDGPQFLIPKGEQVRELNQTRDEAKLIAAQVPDGTSLEKMFGACPGAAGEVRLTYYPVDQPQRRVTTNWKATEAQTDFTHQWVLQRLSANTTYSVKIEARPIGGLNVTATHDGRFKTAPRVSEAAPVRFCMTTCHDFPRRDDGMLGHKIYPAMTKLEPDFVVHAGDIEYYDKPDPYAWTESLMRFKWARIFSLPSNRRFYSNTTSFFLKDDHDTLKNDCWAGQSYGAVSFERGVEIFNQEQFPSLDPRYTTLRWGKDLQVWFLEGRDYRSSNRAPDGPEKTILGETQKQWLFDTLDASGAAFKVIFSPTPIVGPDRTNKSDNHANEVFTYEGNQIRDQLTKHTGVIVLCGDRHWQYASVDTTTGLWEFGCGPGSEKHQLGWKKGDNRPQHRFLRVAGGFLSGDVSRVDGNPRLTMQHRQVDGQVVSRFTFGPGIDPATVQSQR